uniref:hypothetical protein n=1 Tax=Promicromonospora sp. CA-289581 TaxID=3240013 RepID=UPI003F497D00
MTALPTFHQIRDNAYAALGDVQDELRSDWRPGTGPTPQQREALDRARTLIAQAKDALNEAAR